MFKSGLARYDLDFKHPSNALVLKTWTSQQMVVLGGGGTFKSWSSWEEDMSLGMCPWRGHSDQGPFLFLSLFPGHYEVSSFALSCAAYHDILPCHKPKSNGARDSGLKPLKSWAKIKFTSFSLFFSGILSQQYKASTYLSHHLSFLLKYTVHFCSW
jgi:hypothetical protein